SSNARSGSTLPRSSSFPECTTRMDRRSSCRAARPRITRPPSCSPGSARPTPAPSASASPGSRMPEVRCFTPGEASDDLLLVVRLLLEQAFAGDFSPEDWEHALGGWHVVAAADGVALAHAAVVPRVL